MGEILSRDEVIRKALSTEIPQPVGEPIVIKNMQVEDKLGNIRNVEFIGFPEQIENTEGNAV